MVKAVPIQMRRVEGYSFSLVTKGGPGAFNWSDTEYLNGRTVKVMQLCLPSGYPAMLPVYRKGEERPNLGEVDGKTVASWEWDGNEDKPTLTQSFLRSGLPDPHHFWIRAGLIEDC